MSKLHAHHQLVTHGPYKYVRPPIYFGVGLAGVGGILLYRSRTLMFITALLSGLILRARREEQALAAEFGVDWDVYCRRVPAWFPRH